MAGMLVESISIYEKGTRTHRDDCIGMFRPARPPKRTFCWVSAIPTPIGKHFIDFSRDLQHSLRVTKACRRFPKHLTRCPAIDVCCDEAQVRFGEVESEGILLICESLFRVRCAKN